MKLIFPLFTLLLLPHTSHACSDPFLPVFVYGSIASTVAFLILLTTTLVYRKRRHYYRNYDVLKFVTIFVLICSLAIIIMTAKRIHDTNEMRTQTETGGGNFINPLC